MTAITYKDLSGNRPAYTVHNPIVDEHELRTLKTQFSHIYNPVNQTLILFL